MGGGRTSAPAHFLFDRPPITGNNFPPRLEAPFYPPSRHHLAAPLSSGCFSSFARLLEIKDLPSAALKSVLFSAAKKGRRRSAAALQRCSAASPGARERRRVGGGLLA